MWYSPSEYALLAVVSVRNNQTDGAQMLLTKIFSKTNIRKSHIIHNISYAALDNLCIFPFLM